MEVQFVTDIQKYSIHDRMHHIFLRGSALHVSGCESGTQGHGQFVDQENVGGVRGMCWDRQLQKMNGGCHMGWTAGDLDSVCDGEWKQVWICHTCEIEYPKCQRIRRQRIYSGGTGCGSRPALLWTVFMVVCHGGVTLRRRGTGQGHGLWSGWCLSWLSGDSGKRRYLRITYHGRI